MKKVLVSLFGVGCVLGLVYVAYVIPSQMLESGLATETRHTIQPGHTKTTETEPSVTPELMEQVTALRSLNVRSDPGVTAPVIGALYAGDGVTLTGWCDRGWAQIKWRQGSAWVKASFLSGIHCG